jgi:hypothetical protein
MALRISPGPARDGHTPVKSEVPGIPHGTRGVLPGGGSGSQR